MKPYHRIEDIRFEHDYLYLTIDGQPRTFNLRDASSRLAEATEQEQQTFEISPSGYGIHWPLLDEDLSIDGLLGVPHAPPSKIKNP